MKANNFIYRLLFFVLIIASCGSGKTKSAGEFVKWCDDPGNGLVLKKELGQFSFTLCYTPSEYLAIKELSKGKELNQVYMDSALKEYSDLQYFTLRLGSLHGGEFLRQEITKEQDYFDRIYYYNSLVDKDIFLVEGNDTLKCVMHHFERTYSVAPYDNLLLAFEKGKGNAPKKVVYDDHILGTGPVIITISEEAINNIPHISL